MTDDERTGAASLTRAGLKLEAAMTLFPIADRVKGRACIDIGCSHGGFMTVLLRAGAASVTGVDVGHGQLRDALRTDPRVTLLERANFRTLPLHVAAGPFEFFTVDVSFASARSMLRGLSRRLRPGAEGVVLLKPQFELPRELVPRGGVIESRNLRKLAVNRFRRKARTLGFEVLAREPSPVPGGEGTVEILLYVRFDPATAELGGDTDEADEPARPPRGTKAPPRTEIGRESRTGAGPAGRHAPVRKDAQAKSRLRATTPLGQTPQRERRGGR